MRFIFGAMPQDPEFDPENQGWTSLREPGPGKMQLIAVVVGVSVGLLLQLLFWLAGADVSPLQNTRNAPIGLCIMLGSIPAHELLHLLCFPSFGLSKRSIIGFWPRMFGAYVYYDGALSRNRTILISACPFMLLSIMPLLSSFVTTNIPVLVVAVSYLNGLICGADLVGIFLLVKQVPSGALVRSKGYHSYWQKEYGKNAT
jgi:hypothetical protein